MNKSRTSKLKSEIEKTIKERNLTFFIGAGISKISNLPNWFELINAMCDEISLPKKDKFDNNELLSIPQKYYYELNKNDDLYYDFLNKHLNSESLETNEIHDLLMLFKPKKIITTNFDDLIERTANKLLLSYKVISKDSDISTIDVNPFILKVHGDLKNRNIVLKEDDYLNYEKDFNLINTLLKTIFATDTVVFIGYNLNDYNIKLILNWAKNALDDKFIQPYFIYTDCEKLLKSEISYFKSRKLKLIDSHIFVHKNSEYIERYRASLKFLLDITENKGFNQNNTNSFNFLFNKFQILNQLNSIRTIDIVTILSPYIDSENPYTLKSINNSNLFTKYFILKTKQSEGKLTKIEEIKIETIDSVLSKSNILYYYDNSFIRFDVAPKKIGNEYLIYNDFDQMNLFVLKEYNNIHDNFRKAYYLAKLKNYEKALELYERIADDSFKTEDYITLFLTQINRSNIYTIGYDYIDQSKYNTLYLKSFFKKNSDKLFENLPINAQLKLSFLADYGKLKSIYKNAYLALTYSSKYRDDLKKGVKFIGAGGINRQLKLFNESIDFSQSNFILDDEFKEFRDLIQSSMKSILSKVSYQNRVKLIKDDSLELFNVSEEQVLLDEVDFYCLITYFTDKEIDKLFKEYDLENLIFDTDVIKRSSLNLLRTLNDLKFQESNINWYLFYRSRISSLLSLLKYLRMEVDLFNDILETILNSDSRKIEFNVIFFLLTNQSNLGLEFNDKTYTLLLCKIKYWLQLELSSLKMNTLLTLSPTSKYHYFDLVGFVPIKYSSEHIIEINLIIKEILDLQNIETFKRILRFNKLINTRNRNLLLKNLLKVLLNKFEEELFLHYIVFGNSLPYKLKNVFIEYLIHYIEIEKKKNVPNGIYINFKKYDWIIKIIRYSFFEKIQICNFDNLLGLDNELDFYINPYIFDYSKFEIIWITSLGHFGLNKITEDLILKNKLKIKLKEYLSIKNLEISERMYITKLYLKYFD